MARPKTSNFPLIPFDGQEFIDAWRIKWVYDGSTKCWRRSGTVPEIPLATETQNGLLSRNLKQLLDSIPDKGGHFGILARPLLSVVPQDLPIKVSDKVFSAAVNESGSVVFGRKPKNGDQYEPATFGGHFLRFTKGTLKNSAFLIYTNDENSFSVQGDASAASTDDEFVVFNPIEANEDGAIMGNIELVSDTLDIECVDNMGKQIAIASDCRTDYKDCAGGSQAPGLDIKINDDVLDSFCVELRSCKGPVGSKGATGADGADGTGDGPAGEMGDPGEDAPDVGHQFTGIKIIESEDIYDSAVVGLELDADAGKLHVLKAKVVVPDDDSAANQVITSPIDRSLEWTDDEFGYNLLKPLNDPIETKVADDADVTMAVFPKGYEIQTTGTPDDIDKSRVTQFNSVTLSNLIDRVIDHFRERIVEIGEDYDREIKTFIEEKDAKARNILANLAQDLSQCEWELPIEFCLGITPDECHDPDGGGDGGGGGGGGGTGTGTPTPWPHPGDTPKFPGPPWTVVPVPGDTLIPGDNNTTAPGSFTQAELPSASSPSQFSPPATTESTLKVQWSGLLTWAGSAKLPENAAFAFRYHSGALRTLSSSYFVSPNTNSSGEGLIFIPIVNGLQASPESFPVIQSFDPNDLNSVEQAYKTGYYQGQLQGQEDRVVIGGSGTVDGIYAVILARAPILEESSVRITVNALYDPADPIPGVPTNTTVVLNKGGVITAVTPNLIAEGVPTPVTIRIGADGGIAQAGATVEFLGPTAVTWTLTAITDTAITGSINIAADPLFPAPQDYDVLVVNTDGSNGIGTSVVTSFT
jgi:hypothetical protein